MPVEVHQPYTEIYHIRIWGLPSKIRENNQEAYKDSTKRVLSKSGLTLMAEPLIFPYPTEGLAIFAPLSESGITGYTWPNKDYADYLLHTCAQGLDLDNLPYIVKEVFKTEHVLVKRLLRQRETILQLPLEGRLISSPVDGTFHSTL